MEQTAKPPRQPPGFISAPARWWRNLAIPTLPVLACFLGGATEKWSEGIIVALLGVILLSNPPRFSLGRFFNIIFVALVAGALLGFLPARWFFQPAWRVALVQDLGIELPQTLSPQPWITLGCFLSFLAGMSWLYYVSALDLDLREVRHQLRVFSAGIILLAALCLALYAAHTALSFWHNERGFGPFPNRNQTANLFGLAAVVILACGQDDLRHGKKRWIGWLLGFGLIIAAIVLDFSRAGVLILVAGSALWLTAFILRKGSTARIAFGFSGMLILLTAMLIFGGPTLERFHLRASDAIPGQADPRWAIFHDTISLVRASPWSGLGLGNFEGVFEIFRAASTSPYAVLHPESDWFWLGTEMGWPAVFLTIAGIALLVRRIFPLQEGTNQRFRVAALIAVGLFALHGAVDVSGHRIGTAFASIFLLGLALRRPGQLRPKTWLPWMFRGVGLVLVIVGIAWIVATRYSMPLPGGVGVENETRLALAANRGRNFKDTVVRTTRALEWAPLRWQLYFLRALGRLGAKKNPDAALADFRRARFLQPTAYELPLEEGTAWLSTHPVYAITAWREALRLAGERRSEILGQMLSLAAEHRRDLIPQLEEAVIEQHDLAVVYLERRHNEEFPVALRRLLEHDPNLETFSGEERAELFRLWSERGDLAALARAVEAHPDWMDRAWPGVAKYYASQKNYRGAIELARRRTEEPRLPLAPTTAALGELEQAFRARPDNYETGLQLYREQARLGRNDDALMTARHFTEHAGAPRYFYFLEAESWAAKGNWERAWEAWEKFQKPKLQ